MWFPLALGAGGAFAGLATLYRVAAARGTDPTSIAAARLLLGALVAAPVLLLLQRDSLARFDRALALGVLVAGLGAAAYAAQPHPAALLALAIGALGAAVVGLNVLMITHAARRNVNAAFPLAVAAATYIAAAFALNVLLFDELRGGAAPYLRTHWPRLLGLLLVIGGVLLMRLG